MLYIRVYFMAAYIQTTILTINIDLSLIRVFQRTSQTDVNANTSNILMYSYISINILRIRVYHIHRLNQELALASNICA